MRKGETLELIKEGQRRWAALRGIEVAPNGRVKNLADNLFAPLHTATRAEISEGDGGELGTPDNVGKLYSLWSSSALPCNMFDYWRERSLAPLLKALSVKEADCERLGFEQKFRTGVLNARANIDVVLRPKDSEHLPIAIESKFTEPYQSREKECLRPSYLQNRQIWNNLPECRTTAEALGVAKAFECLDAGQLLKHILGLTRTFGQRRFVLLYLWHEVPDSAASDQHRAEVVEFSRLISPEVEFRHQTYQQLFSRLAPDVLGTSYEIYLKSRYFHET